MGRGLLASRLVGEPLAHAQKSPGGADAPDSPSAVTDDAAPALPERRPQGHLAKGLRGRPTAGQPAVAGDPGEPAAGRSSGAMSAMQRGVRKSRGDAKDGSGK